MASSLELSMSSDGCSHYRRKCKIIGSCCAKVYFCRFCHDEKENHVLNRKEIRAVVCTKCAFKQRVGRQCKNCNTQFGQYVCFTCNLFDDEMKGQFHCDKCGICRVGGERNYFHCDRCGLCLAIGIRHSHKCVKDVSHAGCPICLEDLHTSRIPCRVPQCGHLLHQPCYDSLIKNNYKNCTICSAPW